MKVEESVEPGEKGKNGCLPTDSELLLDNRKFLVLQLSLKEWIKESF